MRLTVRKDKKITGEEMDQLKRDFTKLYKKNAGVTPEFYIEEQDYSNYPTYVDSDGDKRPTEGYLKDISSDIYDRYGEFGTDHIVVLVHEDNWRSPTIWGTAYSNLWHTYQVTYCRFDKDNSANSLGTLHHEVMHTLDMLIKTTIGVDIDKIDQFAPDWDRQVVHGNGANYDYIRHKDNLDALQYISPYLHRAYAKRKELHDGEMSKMRDIIISLAQQIIVILRSKLNKKNGVPK